MRSLLIRRALLVAAALACTAATGGEATPPGPRGTVTSALEELIDTVSVCRFALATDPAGLRALADRSIRPALDVLFAGQIILGKWWGEASADQRREFAQSLYGSLANRYGPSLLLLTEQTITVRAAADPDAGRGEAVVPITVRVPGYPVVDVELVLRRTGDRWRVYDARFEDLSPVLQLREQFSAEIRRDGLQAVIDRLAGQAAAGTPGTLVGRCLRTAPAA